MKNQVTTFDFNGRNLTCTTDEAGNALFRVDEVCELLEFGNPRQALESHVDSGDVQKLDTIDSLGRVQQVNYVTEYGLYDLATGSRKPEARAFKRWVTHEVLPSIRKTGSYTHPNAAPAVASPPLMYLEQSVELLQQSSEIHFRDLRGFREELDRFYDSLPQKMENIYKAVSGELVMDIKGAGLLIECAVQRIEALERLMSRFEKRMDRLEDRTAS